MVLFMMVTGSEEREMGLGRSVSQMVKVASRKNTQEAGRMT